MTTKYVSDGSTIDVVAAGAVTSGSIWRGVDLCGVYVNSGVTGGTVPVSLRGVHTVLKDAMSTAWVVGDKLYANSSLEATPSATSAVALGFVVEAATTGAVEGKVLLGTF